MYQSHSAASWVYRGLPPSPAIEQFHKQLSDYNVTPLTSLPELAKELGVHAVVVKDESDRFGLPAFKILGASWAIHSAVAAKCNMDIPCSLEELGRSARAQGLRLVTCTEGNWGRATARMAKYLQIPATVFVSQFMEQATRDLIASEGAQVTVVDGDYDMSIAAARRYAQETGGLLVMDVSWEGYEDIPQVRDSAQNLHTLLMNASEGSRGIQHYAHRNRSAAS
jgi:diaminopropionate ammonia-lyase